MRFLVTMTLLATTVSGAHADTFVYVSQAPEKRIAIYRLNLEDGSLKPVASVSLAGAPGALGVDPQMKYLFASVRSTEEVASFRIDPTAGSLTALSTAPLGKGNNAAFVGTDRTGRWLLSASYSGGKVVVHRLEGGKIQTPAVQTVSTARTAHNIAFDPGNRFVFVPHVAPNAVYQFRFDPDTGKLTEAGKAPGGAEGAGPRHLKFHPTLNRAYSSDEQGSSITAYRFDPRTGLHPMQTLPTLPPDFKGRNTTAEVQVHPNGRFVWVSNRGHDSLAGFAIGRDGKLTPLGQTPTEKTPRSFDIGPAGRWVLSAGQGSGNLAVYRVDSDTGKLTRLHTYPVGKSLAWVLAVDLAK